MIVLCSTLHDPKKGLQWLSDKHLDELKNIFDQIIIVSSPFTNDEYLNDLKQKVHIVKRENNNIAQTYYTAIKAGYAFDPDYIFYCDFDRILHWIHNSPKELIRAVHFLKEETQKKKQGIDYIVCERTKEGYKKHHEALFETEQLANCIVSKAMQEKTPHDFFGGSFIYSKKAASVILKEGKNVRGQNHWGYWPTILKKKKVRILYKKWKGLNWETPNQYREEVVAAGGVERWREALSSSQEWKRRTVWAREFVEKII